MTDPRRVPVAEMLASAYAEGTLTPQTLAEAVWLLDHLYPDLVAPPRSRPAALPLDQPSPDQAQSPQPTAEPAPEAAPTPSPAERAAIDPAPPTGQRGMQIVRAHDGPPRSAPGHQRPALPALAESVELSRALRILHRKVGAPGAGALDEAATVHLFAEAGALAPVSAPVTERWLDLAVVIDTSISMALWQPTLTELTRVLRSHQAFRDVRIWSIDGDAEQPRLHAGPLARRVAGDRNSAELTDPTGRRLILIVTDGVGRLWQTAAMATAILEWADVSPLTILNVLPERLWHRTGLPAVSVSMHASPQHSGLLRSRANLPRLRANDGQRLVPVVALDPVRVGQWASAVVGDRTAGQSMMAVPLPQPQAVDAHATARSRLMSAAELIKRFRLTAAPAAYSLAAFLSAAPLTVPVMRLIQRQLVPDSGPADLAEVFLSGLLVTVPGMVSAEPDQIVYDFAAGLPGESTIREELLANLPRTDAFRVLDLLAVGTGSEAEPFGGSLDFRTLVPEPLGHATPPPESRPFAEVVVAVLNGLGGPYHELAESIVSEPFAQGTGPTTESTEAPWALRNEFFAELELLYRAAGRPSYRRISTEIRRADSMPDTVSQETVGAILRGEALARWSKVESVVRQLAAMAVHRPNPDDEVQRIHALWSEALDSEVALPQPPDPVVGASVTPIGLAPLPPDPVVGASVTPIGLAPQRNLGFMGRREVLDRMAAEIDAQPWKPLVLYGLGGVGKTQLAAEFMYRHAGRYAFVAWITAEDPSQAVVALASLGERLDWPVRFDMGQTVRTVLTMLESRPDRWLIIYDNAGAPDEIHSLLPQAGGDLIVTTRDAAWLELGRPVEVDVFTRTESIDLLNARCHEISFDEADQLADRLGDLPLALEQVAAMQSATRKPVRDYLQQFDERALELLGSTPPGDHRTTVTTSFTVAAEQVRLESPATAQLLEMLCCLGAEPISVTLLGAGGRQIAPPLGRLLDQSDILREAIWRLRRYGLVKVTDDGQAVQVHRLVQAIVRDAMPDAERAEAYLNACRMLAEANPGRPTDPLNWDMYLRIGPHLRPARVAEVAEPGVRQVLIDHAEYLYLVGDFDGSRRLSQDALEAWERQGITFDRQTFACLRRVVAAQHELGHVRKAFDSAKAGYERAASHAEFGPDDSVTLELADMLAVAHRVLGEYEEALQLDRQILDRFRRTRDWDDGLTIQARNNLAASLRAMGDFRSAHELDAELVESCRAKYRTDHPLTLLAVSNVARDLYGLGRYAAALDLQRSTLGAHRDRLGFKHPLILAAWRTIVLGLRKTGQMVEAREEGHRLYHACLAHLGSENRITLAAMVTYVNTLCAIGEVYRAVELAAQAVRLHSQVYGDRNPFTLVAATNQAITLRAVGERRRARSVGETSLHALRQALGTDHPYTIASAVGVCNDLVLDHEEETARRLLAGTLEDSRRIKGEHHPDTLICAINLGLVLGDEPSGRESILGGSIDALRQALGPEHPTVAAAVAGQMGECDIEPPPV